MKSCQELVTSLLFFYFFANLEEPGSRIPDAQSVEVKFSLAVIFYLTKTENRTKKSPTQLSSQNGPLILVRLNRTKIASDPFSYL